MLDVYLNKRLIGQLLCGRSGWALEYDTHWQTSSQGFGLGPHLPRDAGVIADMTKAQPVRHFFEYLLPKAARSMPKAIVTALEHLAQAAPHLGDPLTLMPSGLKPCSDRADGLSERDLVLRFQQTVERPPRSTPLHATEPRTCYGTNTVEATEEVNLPFLASNGLPASMWLGRFSTPANVAQSSHFMRLDFDEGTHLPCAAIDHCWTTLLDRSIGLDTPFIGLRQFPETAAVVRHLDHILYCKSDDTALMQARYVVSTMQLLGLSPKYRFLPITVEQAMQYASLCMDLVSATTAPFRWMVSCLLIGGCNTSASTLHFRISADGIRLAAHDHLFCAAVYANEQNADELSPNAQARYKTIGQGALLALTDHLGYDVNQARHELLRPINMLAPQLSFVATHLSQALGHSPTRVVETDFLARIRRRMSETAWRLGGKVAEV